MASSFSVGASTTASGIFGTAAGTTEGTVIADEGLGGADGFCGGVTAAIGVGAHATRIATTPTIVFAPDVISRIVARSTRFVTPEGVVPARARLLYARIGERVVNETTTHDLFDRRESGASDPSAGLVLVFAPHHDTLP